MKQFEESRVALGKAFGTRKAQNLLTSREINKVDVTDMDKSVGSAIVSQVEESTKNMPSMKELGKAMLDERPVPKYNQDAVKVEDVYKREDLISEEEWESVWVMEWVKNGDVQTYAPLYLCAMRE
jgi:DNA-directed RNA polymerase I subunit RPA49